MTRSKQTIGIIGSGNIGGALARAFTLAGHHVVIANSRGPATLGTLVAELGELASAGTVEQAARASDLVVVTIPLKAVASIPSDLLTGRLVIDTNNYYPDRDGHIAELDNEVLTTSEYVAQHFAGARVVKAFNHIPALDIAEHAQKAGTPERRALMVYGEDAAAVEHVAALIDEIGFDAVKGGGLAESWRIQRDTPGYGPRFSAGELTEKLSVARRYSGS
jgi:predicted dinucleotide-binding enzyme